MKQIIIIIFISLIAFDGNSQCKRNNQNWNTYIEPVLDSIFGTKKRVFISAYSRIEKHQPSAVISFLSENYGIDDTTWRQICEIANNNFRYDPGWDGGFSSNKRNKLTSSKRFRKNRIEVISISRPIFISRYKYLISITQYCTGLCSSTDIYIIELNNKTGGVLIKQKINVGVS